MKQRWLFSVAVQEFERGAISPDEFAEQFVDEWKLSLTPKKFLEDFARWPRGFFPGAQEILQDLRQSYRVGCLSNSNEVHWQQLDAIDSVFDITLFSHLMGTIKPYADIFIKALDQCSVEPNEVIFFDDCQSNVDTAIQIGMHAFLADGFESLKKTLEAENLLQ